jgi:hypothetical protein
VCMCARTRVRVRVRVRVWVGEGVRGRYAACVHCKRGVDASHLYKVSGARHCCLCVSTPNTCVLHASARLTFTLRMIRNMWNCVKLDGNEQISFFATCWNRPHMACYGLHRMPAENACSRGRPVHDHLQHPCMGCESWVVRSDPHSSWIVRSEQKSSKRPHR